MGVSLTKAVAEVGARDFQHAFDRALLQGKIDCARWLHEHGARLEPGIVMGACETLNPVGLQFLADLNAPFTDRRGDRLAPLALVLETYGRNPAGKHAGRRAGQQDLSVGLDRAGVKRMVRLESWCITPRLGCLRLSPWLRPSVQRMPRQQER